MLDFQGCQACGHGIVGAIEQNDVHESHAHEQRNDSQKHKSIFNKDLFSSNVSPTNSKKNDCDGIESTPPADQKCRFVVMEGPQRGSRSGKATKYVHQVGLSD